MEFYSLVPSLPTFSNSPTHKNGSSVPDKSITKLKLNYESIYKEFLDSFPLVLAQILESVQLETLESSINSPEVIKRIKLVIEQNVPHGKLVRGITFLQFYRALCPKFTRTRDEEFEGYVLAWILEILQTASLIADDMMDNSITRRGSICWFRREDIGMSAVNDVLLLENLVYHILHTYFHKKTYYSQLLKLLQDTLFKTIIGESLDLQLSKYRGRKLLNLNFEKYENMVKYKTSYYTFHLPIKFAILAGGMEMNCGDKMAKIDEVLNGIGEYFQVQDDVIDCFGDPEISGKIGTDIGDNKCTWLLVKALEICNEDEKETIIEFYGRPGHTHAVVELYKSIDLLSYYSKHEQKSYVRILYDIEELPITVPKEPFREILQSIQRKQCK